MVVFGGYVEINIHKYVTNYHFQMEDGKICEVGKFLILILDIFWLTNSNRNLM
jgi:hypothetical protein